MLFSRSVVYNLLQPHGLQHARPPCPSPAPGVYSDSCPLSQWRHPTISSSVVPFSSCPQSFPASGSFPMSQLFTSGGQSIRASASASVLPMNIQDWSPLGWAGWISLQSKGLLKVFSNTTVQKHQFFCAQPSLWSSSHTCTWISGILCSPQFPFFWWKSNQPTVTQLVRSGSQDLIPVCGTPAPCPLPPDYTLNLCCSKCVPSNSSSSITGNVKNAASENKSESVFLTRSLGDIVLYLSVSELPWTAPAPPPKEASSILLLRVEYSISQTPQCLCTTWEPD